MRRWFVALCLIGLASGANAQEFELPTLRGSSAFVPAAPVRTNWAGFYFGGQLGRSSAQMNFSGATESLVRFMLRELALEEEAQPSTWQVLGSKDTSGVNGGFFFGYNTQWDEAIIGFDFNYSRGTHAATSPIFPIARMTSAGGNIYLVNLTGTGSMEIHDFASARVRAGWAIANFMPYATLGFAVGRADVARSANAFIVENPPPGYPGTLCSSAPNCTEANFSQSETKNDAWLYGWSAGGGLEMLVMPNIFLRGEYEYINFTKVQGIKAQIHSGRVGAGLKF
ncbi:MAG: outer membrane protein [Xanthobacteraceae bacterium]